MNPIVENLTGTAAMTDQMIATDLLQSAKAGIRNYAGCYFRNRISRPPELGGRLYMGLSA